MKAIELTFAALVGFVAGLAFFGGLWWTLRRLATSRSPMLLATTSLFVRLALVCAAFAAIGLTSWPRLVASVVGFVVARWVWLRRVGSMESEEARDATHA